MKDDLHRLLGGSIGYHGEALIDMTVHRISGHGLRQDKLRVVEVNKRVGKTVGL
jgi:hypothetical protein